MVDFLTAVLLWTLIITATAHHQQYELGPEFSDIDDVLHSIHPPQKSAFETLYPAWEPIPADIRASGPPLLLSGQEPEAARAASEVQGLLGNVPGYSGYLSVEPKYNSSIFFWYFPSERGAENAPLVLWLQGGPGATSLFGLFTEIGPYEVVDGQLNEREHSWHKNFSLLFFDSPVGTGFSYTDHDDGYCKNQDQVAKHLYKALQEFYTVFPEVRDQPLILTGESYAGKHIPSFAVEIHRQKGSSNPKINLKGMAIGNPFIDPPENVRYSEIGSVLGLVDTPTKRTMVRLEAAITSLVQRKKFLQAHQLMSLNLFVMMKNSNYTNIYNLLRPHENTLDADFVDFIQSAESRMSLHVGDIPFKNIGKVYANLIPDFMNTGMDYMRILKGQYPILLYSGHMDIIVAYPFTRKVVEALSGPCSHDPWIVKGRLAGYKHMCDGMELALVHTAGHMVPTDQPVAALDLISDFIQRAVSADNKQL